MVEVEEADEDLKEEVTEECTQFGRVERVRLHVREDVWIFVQFESHESAVKALESLNGRWFGGRFGNYLARHSLRSGLHGLAGHGSCRALFGRLSCLGFGCRSFNGFFVCCHGSIHHWELPMLQWELECGKGRLFQPSGSAVAFMRRLVLHNR